MDGKFVGKMKKVELKLFEFKCQGFSRLTAIYTTSGPSSLCCIEENSVIFDGTFRQKEDASDWGPEGWKQVNVLGDTLVWKSSWLLTKNNSCAFGPSERIWKKEIDNFPAQNSSKRSNFWSKTSVEEFIIVVMTNDLQYRFISLLKVVLHARSIRTLKQKPSSWNPK